MFEVTIGEAGLKETYQAAFPKEVGCVHCGGWAQIGFVAMEQTDNDDIYVCSARPDDREGLWLHDVCAVAVYFCRSCLETTSKYNQA